MRLPIDTSRLKFLVVSDAEPLRQFEEEALPRLEQEPGFRGITLGVNYQHGQAIALALWETEADMRQSEKLAGEVRDGCGGRSMLPAARRQKWSSCKQR